MREIVFIDSRVEDYQFIVASVGSEAEVVILDATQDGVEQITQLLEGYKGIKEIHIVSLGTEESLQLGATQLSTSSLDAYTSQLQKWATALTDDASILLYDYGVTSEQAGEALIQRLSQLTGVEVTTADDLTDGTQFEGDWYLNQQLDLELHHWIQPTEQGGYTTSETYIL